MSTDDSPLGRCELFCTPGEKKTSLLLENLRGGDKNISAHSGFKDPIVLRVMCLVHHIRV